MRPAVMLASAAIYCVRPRRCVIKVFCQRELGWLLPDATANRTAEDDSLCKARHGVVYRGVLHGMVPPVLLPLRDVTMRLICARSGVFDLRSASVNRWLKCKLSPEATRDA